MKKIIGLGMLAVGVMVCGSAEARFLSKKSVANQVTARTGAAQSTVVGRTADRATMYVRSEGTKKGTKYVVTRQVNANTGAIKRTSGNQLGALKSEAALKNRNGAVGGQKADFAYSIKANRNAMTDGGNVKLSAKNSGFPGRTEGRLVSMTKTGAVKAVKDSATDGLKSRW